MAMKSDARRTLIILAVVCTLPVVASYLAYYVWQPEGTVNYGELISPAPLPEPIAERASDLRGRWALVYASDNGCDERCARSLYHMRQVRTAQGEHMDRVERLWLRASSEAPPAELLEQHAGLVVETAAPRVIASLPAQDRVMLMDPYGKIMMRYPADADPKRMIRDLARLLKYSRS